MYTSDINGTARKAAKTALGYLVVAVVCLIFGAVYELFSHEVYSFYMIYAFAFPLLGGTFPFLVISLFRVKEYPGVIVRNLYHSGIATLTVGSILQGVLEIYGTTNRLVRFYWIVGIALMVMALLSNMFRPNAKEEK